MAISDKLLQVNQVKQDLKTAIETKGVEMSGVPFTNYHLKIGEISGGIDFPPIEYDEIDLFGLSYYIYSQSDALEKLPNAWQDSLEVDISEIEKASTSTTQYGKLQYPNGELFGVIIPNSVTSIGEYAFYNWSSNNQPLVIPNSVTSIDSYAFRNWSANTHPLVIPNSVTSIGSNAFHDWTSNNQPLVIPNSVTSIDSYAFYNWRANNQPLVIPNSVTSIDSYAFYNWSANTHPLVIPDSVTSIGSNAFRSWSLVPYVEIQAIIPPSLANSSVFSNQKNTPIYVPDASVDDYKTATNWVDLASRIFPISEKQ